MSATVAASRPAGDARLPLWLAVVLGALLAVVLSKVWTLELRWFVVTVGSVTMLAIAMMWTGSLGRMLLPTLFLCIPLAGIESWLFFDEVSPEQAGNAVYAGLIGIGPIDFVICGLALSWFIAIFVTREETLPRLTGIDVLVLLVPLSYLVSTLGAPRPLLGVFALVYLCKHVFVYFYVSRHFARRHLRALLVAICLALTLQGGLAVAQSQFQVLQGVARDKGAGDAERREQYEVPGIESRIRAEGTAYDSHALGLFLAMLLPLPLVLMFAEDTPSGRRALYGAFALSGLVALILCFSRAAWLSFALAMPAGLALLATRLRSRQVAKGLLWSIPLLVVLAPWAMDFVHERFSSAPVEIMTTRFEQWTVAWEIWRDNLVFGFGAGNYMEALAQYNFNWALELPVHNVALWIGAETGLFGQFAFFGVIVAAARRLWILTGSQHGMVAVYALAMLVALVAYVLDGLTDPLFREPIVFMTFWHVVAMSVALGRIDDTTPRPAAAEENDR